jgi:hypothetical protein
MHDPAYPAIDRLRCELVTARQGVRELADLDRPTRDRVEAEIRSAVPDLAGRASREAGREAVVAEVRRSASEGADDDTDDGGAAWALWAEVLATALEAAAAVEAAQTDVDGRLPVTT